MENKKLKTVSRASLIVSILPLATLIPVFLKITLPEGVSMVWAGVNIVCALAGIILSIVCVRSNESRSLVNIASTVISAFWCLLMAGIAAMALFLNFMQ